MHLQVGLAVSAQYHLCRRLSGKRRVSTFKHSYGEYTYFPVPRQWEQWEIVYVQQTEFAYHPPMGKIRFFLSPDRNKGGVL